MLTDDRKPIVLLVAAGRGLRAGGGTPKQYRMLAGRMVLAWTIDAFASAMPGVEIVCVIHPDDRALYDQTVSQSRAGGAVLLEPVAGGHSRQESVRLGLNFIHNINKDEKIVLIHDSVRLNISNTLISELVAQARLNGAAVPGFPIPDAIKQADRAGQISGSASRNGLYVVQTPQVFDLDLIHAAHEQAAKTGHYELDDDAAVAQLAGHAVQIVPGEVTNIKLTTAADFALAETLLMNQLSDIRTGQGFDVHAFTDGDAVLLGGILIPHDRRLSGHSDADVVLHALTDAVLGAIADGDIGAHFPPSDPKWKGAPSDQFLRHASELVAGKRGIISHLDVTIIAEAPKIGPHREAMRAAIAEIAGISSDRVSVKATTTERLGFTGRREGIAAQAVATVRLPMGGDT